MSDTEGDGVEIVTAAVMTTMVPMSTTHGVKAGGGGRKNNWRSGTEGRRGRRTTWNY
jgi:hypothetical protein